MVVGMVRMFILVIAICPSSTIVAAASGASDGRHRMGLPIPKVLPLQQQIHSEMSATEKKKSPRNWLWGQPSNDDDDNDEQEDSETNPDESKNGKSSWKESRKPSHPSTKKQGYTRFSIPIFGGMKNNNNTKTNDDNDSDSSNTTTTTTTPVNNRQLERARRKQEREERAERQKVEKEETIKARKSMFERAKAARKEKNRNNNNNNTTTLDDDNNNKTVMTLDESNETETSSLANTTAEDEDDNIKGSSTSANTNNGAAPNTIVYSYPQERPRPTMVYRSMPQRHQQSSSSSMGTTPQGMSPQQALVVTAVASLLSLASRIWIVMWITKQLGWEEDMIDPVQHFVWECLNDRYVKDEKVLTRALQRAPSGYNKFQWWRHLKSLRSSSSSSRTFVSEYDDNNPQKRILPLKTPTRTTVVVNITPNEQLDLSYLSDVVNFLTRVHQSYGFGKDVEVILLLESGGGSVATFGLAASQIARLEHAGMNTTVCVDNIAASGGYMIASQSAQIVIAPFAVVGSIGVQAEFLNFNKVLEKYGVTPLKLKSGENKNLLSSTSPVSPKDIEVETKRIQEIHESFIDLCRDRRPMLDPAVCDGSTMIGSRALSFGLVDRVLTSDEYIWERICDGDYVLKLHRTKYTDQRHIFARALGVLPHLRHRMKTVDMQSLVSRVMQGITVFSMLRNTLLKDIRGL